MNDKKLMNKTGLLLLISRAVELVPEVSKYLSDKTWQVLKTIGQFDRQLWDYALALYRGGDPGTFIDSFAAAIDNQLTRAWNEGANEVGVAPGDMAEEDKQEIQNIIDREFDRVLDLAQAIVDARSRDLDSFRQQFRPRIDLWVNRYNDVVNQAKLYFGGKTRMVWLEGDTVNKCSTCLALDGIVAWASEWEEAGVHPQRPPNQALECAGWRCSCRLEVTDKHRTANALETIMEIATSGHI